MQKYWLKKSIQVDDTSNNIEFNFTELTMSEFSCYYLLSFETFQCSLQFCNSQLIYVKIEKESGEMKNIDNNNNQQY